MTNPTQSPLKYSFRTRVRYERQTLVRIGGLWELMDGNTFGCNLNNYYHPNLKKWLTIQGGKDIAHSQLVEVNCCYGVLCGGLMYTKTEFITPMAEYTDSVRLVKAAGFAVWDMPSMQDKRAYHVAVYIPEEPNSTTNGMLLIF